jgi:uncharacterized protein YuzB (UPF0349 family)
MEKLIDSTVLITSMVERDIEHSTNTTMNYFIEQFRLRSEAELDVFGLTGESFALVEVGIGGNKRFIVQFSMSQMNHLRILRVDSAGKTDESVDVVNYGDGLSGTTCVDCSPNQFATMASDLLNVLNGYNWMIVTGTTVSVDEI